jgi:release factor glutamine methyltransferase
MAFSEITIASALAHASAQLERAGIPSAALDARLLLAHAMGVTPEILLLNNDKILSDNVIGVYSATVARRQQQEPIAYITGSKEFWSLDFYVTCDTLIPRPDSETLVEAALAKAKNLAVQGTKQGLAKSITLLDVGTGTGCLLVALLTELRQALGVGVDKSEPALRVAEENARRHGVSGRAQFTQSHWCDAIDRTFDLIVSNPPYIPLTDAGTLMRDVVGYEPPVALFAGNDGLDAYRALAPQLAEKLNDGGWAVLEVGRGQAQQVCALLAAQGLAEQEVYSDLAAVERCVAARKPGRKFN